MSITNILKAVATTLVALYDTGYFPMPRYFGSDSPLLTEVLYALPAGFYLWHLLTVLSKKSRTGEIPHHILAIVFLWNHNEPFIALHLPNFLLFEMTNIPHNIYKLMKRTTTNKGLFYFFAAIWYGLHLRVRIIWGSTATYLAFKDLAILHVDRGSYWAWALIAFCCTGLVLLQYLNFYLSYAIVTGRDFKDFLTFVSQKFSGR
ncbi:uncharacterized protein B0I36DRAFT_364205 [Microdochium trichocladiopsis]|uniref:TLC domain-containing protein n=1 Tax=Microdochium trichocladiopsis TaxID=1682393 RepID=A0A9P8Y7W2_9PEZI|nr:uncharacterized protein B0I36DRAFT_364205 [Microdochium trichocladiopsis]KAH7029707.1 hypothetical protein B0I36DRAFT_364205 [Microdochium trichocladiopsis]